MAVTVIQGEDRDLYFGVKDTDEDVYIDLTGVSEISVKASATAGGSVEVNLSTGEVIVTDALKGKFTASIHNQKTDLLKIGDRDVEIKIDWLSPKTISSWSFVANVITINSTAHGFGAGDQVVIAGLVATTFAPNGTWVISSVAANSFIFTATSTPTGSPTVSSATAIAGKTRYIQGLKALTVVKRLF